MVALSQLPQIADSWVSFDWLESSEIAEYHLIQSKLEWNIRKFFQGLPCLGSLLLETCSGKPFWNVLHWEGGWILRSISRTWGWPTERNKINQICSWFAERRETRDRRLCKADDRVALLLRFVTIGDANDDCACKADIIISPFYQKTKQTELYRRMCSCMSSGSRRVAFKYFRISASNKLSKTLRDSRLPIARYMCLRDSLNRCPYIRNPVTSLKPASSQAIFKTGLFEQVAPFLSSSSFARSTSLRMIIGCPAASTYTALPGIYSDRPHQRSDDNIWNHAPYFRAHSA